MKFEKAKAELDTILDKLNVESFIANDPICIPKRFSKKEDIEIAAFFASILAWGQRVTIINNTNKLMHWMGEEPHKFILEHSDYELKAMEKFVHRTFNSTDLLYFIAVIKHFYSMIWFWQAMEQVTKKWHLSVKNLLLLRKDGIYFS